jgi:hypothetical protein
VPTHQAGSVACPTKDPQSFVDVAALNAQYDLPYMCHLSNKKSSPPSTTRIWTPVLPQLIQDSFYSRKICPPFDFIDQDKNRTAES